MQKEYKYIVFYTYNKGYRNMQITVDRPIETFAVFQDVQKFVKEDTEEKYPEAQGVLITNIIKISETKKRRGFREWFTNSGQIIATIGAWIYLGLMIAAAIYTVIVFSSL